MIKKAYLLDIDYVVRKDQTYVRLLVKGRKKAVYLYYPNDPYFYAEIPEERAEELLRMEVYAKDGRAIRPKDIAHAKLLQGQKEKDLIKIICHQPSDVPILQKRIPFPCHEFSIPFARRFIYDHRLTPLGVIRYEREGRMIKKILSCESGTQDPKLKTLAFDIETYNPLGAPREKADPIIMMSWEGKSEGVLTTKQDHSPFIRLCENEKAMLEKFSSIVQEEDPDIIFGYNSANFDLPYIDARTKATGANLDIGRRKGNLRQSKRGLVTSVKIPGRIHIDIYPMLRFFGHIGMIKTPDYTLETVAAHLSGKRKKPMNRKEIWKIWDSHNITELAEYALHDSKIVKELGDRYLKIEEELSSLAKLPLFDTSLATSGQLVENLLMYEAAGKGMIIPSKPEGGAIAERMASQIQGAYVKLPEPGVYENIAVLDFRGLYPSIIVSYNIDPSTLVQDSEHETQGCFVSPSGSMFLKKPMGLIPFVLDYLIDFRSKIKKQLKTLEKDSDEYKMLLARSTAIKVVSNSFYGYLAYARSRWYSRECGESVTAYGRKHIAEAIEKAEEAGFKVLYADTDSTFLLMDKKNKDDVQKFVRDLNASLPEKMELELEGFYPRGVFVSKKTGEEKGAKKKYALLGDDGRIKIRGFELVRRDWSPIAKKTQLAVLEAILKEGSKEKAVRIVRDTIERISKGNVSMEELAIVTQLKKDPHGYEVQSPELSAAHKGIERGMSMETGSVVTYIITKKGKSISEKAELAEFAKDYDPDYYINNQVLPAVMKILKELGYDEYSLKVGGKQKTLDFF